MKSIILIFLLFITTSYAATDISLQLAWKNQFQFAGYYIAKEKGYYKNLDLDVNIMEYNNSNTVKDILSHKVDFAVGRSSLVYNKLEGDSIVMLAAIFQHSPEVLLSLKRDDIKNISDLKYKNIMMNKDIVNLASINAMLLSFGINSKNYTLQKQTFNIDDLIDKKTDALYSYISNEPMMLEKRDIPYQVFHPKDYGFDFYSDILYTSQNMIDKHPKTVKNFRDASIKGWEYAIKNIDETINLILTKYNTQNKTKEALEFEAKVLIELMDIQNNKIGSISHTKIEKIAQIYRLMGLTNHNFPLDGLVYKDNDTKEKLNSSFNIELFSKKLHAIVAKPIYEVDTESLPILLDGILNEYKNIKAIKILDSYDDDILFQYYQEEKLKLEKLKQYKLDIIFDGENLANAIIYFETNNLLSFTQEEKQWLKDNPIIKLAVMKFWQYDKNGNNIHIDLIKLLNKYGNINIVPTKYDTWKDGFKDSSSGDIINGIMNLSWSKEREDKFFKYTKAYDFKPIYLIVKKSNQIIKTLDDLKNKTICLREQTISNKIIQEYSPAAKIVNVKTVDKMYESVSSDENIDATLFSHINKDKLTKYNLKIAKAVYTKYGEVAVGINNKYPLLATIINKIYKIIPSDVINKLREKDYKNLDNLKLILTKEEKKWLKNHNKFKVHMEDNYTPFSDMKKDGKFTGYSIDYANMIASKLGVKFIYNKDETWGQAIDNLKNKKIDIIAQAINTQQRQKFALFTKDYMTYQESIIVKDKNYHLANIEKLNGYKVGVVGGYNQEKVIKKYYPKIKLKIFKDNKALLKGILVDEIDAAVSTHQVMQYNINRLLLNHVSSIPILDNPNYPETTEAFAIANNLPLLRSALQKAFNSISNEDKLKLQLKWFGVSKNIDKKIAFTNSEQKWIDKKQSIKYVYDDAWKPLEWRDDLGKHKGIIADLIKLLSEKSGVEFSEVRSDSWSDAIEKVKSKEVLMFSGIGETTERKKYLNFTDKELFSTPYVIVSRVEDNYLESSEYMKNKKIGIFKNSTIEALMKEKHPKWNYIYVSSSDAYQKLQNKDIDAFITNGVSAQYNLNIHQYKDLKIADKTKLNLNLKIAVHKDMPKEVLSILNKVVLKVTKKEIDDIVFKYTNIQVTEKTDWKLIGIVTFILVLVILFIILLNYRLKKLVDNKTKELVIFNETLETTVSKRTEELASVNKKTRDSIEYASLIQSSIVPDFQLFQNYFDDYFVIWHPKDIVGGDIYFFDTLRNEEESLLMVIDCTGHGVSGAFVTMIVKSIERQIIAMILNDKNLIVDCAEILSFFNKQIKYLLKQESKDSVSDVGFDAQILYFNKKDKVMKYAGARNPLYYMQNDELITINGDRSSVGYAKSKIDFKFTEHIIDISIPTTLYISSDGYWDQCGGERKLPFGKVRLKKLIKESYQESLSDQKEIFLYTLADYQDGMIRNDDVTFVALKV